MFDKIHNFAVFLTAYNREILGYAAIYANDIKDHTAFITLIGVHPSHQRKGIGASLLKACISVAESNHMRKIKLQVNQDNLSAIRFYEKWGFSEIGSASANSLYMIKRI